MKVRILRDVMISGVAHAAGTITEVEPYIYGILRSNRQAEEYVPVVKPAIVPPPAKLQKKKGN